MQKLIRPKYFMPIHGEYHMLRLHADVAIECGLAPDHTFVLANGDTVQLYHHKVTEGPRVHADVEYLDSTDSTGLSTSVIKERKILSENGVVSVEVGLDLAHNRLLFPPKITTKGFSYFTTTTSNIVIGCANQVQDELLKRMQSKFYLTDLEDLVENVTSKYFYKLTHRNPLVVPVLIPQEV